VTYRQPDRDALDELDGHADRVRQILDRVDAAQVAERRRRRWLVRLAVAVGGVGAAAFVWALRSAWPVFVFVAAVAVFAIGGAFIGSKNEPSGRRSGDGLPPGLG